MNMASEWLLGEPEFNRWYVKWEIADYIRSAILWLAMNLAGHLLTYFGILHADWNMFFWGGTVACVLVLATGTVIAKINTKKRLAEARRRSQIDWNAFSFLLPTEATGLWLIGLTRDEPTVAFKFRITNASDRFIEITGIRGLIQGFNSPPRLIGTLQLPLKSGPFELTIEQPVTAASALNYQETLSREGGVVRFSFQTLQFDGKAILENGAMPLQGCYVNRGPLGFSGLGIPVRGPIDLRAEQGYLIPQEPCFISQLHYDSQGNCQRRENGNSN
jgi:hypothetical protein